MEEQIENLKSFLSLVNSYLGSLSEGHYLDELVSKLDSEVFLYEYNKDACIEDLKNYMGFLKSDEDIENNWYALAYAAFRFFKNNQTGNKLIDSYILKMTKRN